MIELPRPYTLVIKESTTSTNTDAAELAEAGAPDLTVVWAQTQCAARGRYGRQWQAPRGNLFWSAIVRIPAGDPLDGLTISVAMAVFDAVRAHVPADRAVAIKWPNDILIENRKTSGILIERNERAGWAIVGVGINVLHAPDSQAVTYPATSMADEGSGASLDDVCLNFSNAFLRRIEAWRDQGFTPALRQGYLERLWKLNETITVSFDAAREQTQTGRLAGIDEQGHLLLDVDGRIVTIAAADVS